MIVLFVAPGCPFCESVEHSLARLNIPFKRQDVTDSAVAAQLFQDTGTRIVPHIVDYKTKISYGGFVRIGPYLLELELKHQTKVA